MRRSLDTFRGKLEAGRHLNVTHCAVQGMTSSAWFNSSVAGLMSKQKPVSIHTLFQICDTFYNVSMLSMFSVTIIRCNFVILPTDNTNVSSETVSSLHSPHTLDVNVQAAKTNLYKTYITHFVMGRVYSTSLVSYVSVYV